MRDCDSDEESSAASLAQSHRSKEYPPEFSTERKPSKLSEALKMRDCDSDEESSAASLAQSDRSKEYPPEFSTELSAAGRSGQTSSSRLQMPGTLNVFESEALAFLNKALKTHKKVLSAKYKGLFEKDEQEDEAGEKLLQCDSETSEAALRVIRHILETINHDEHPRILQQSHYETVEKYQRKLRSALKRKHGCLLEVINAEQQPVPLKKIYTKLYLIEGDSGEVNNEHEVRQIEDSFNKQRSSETLIECEDVFKPLPNQRQPIRTVLTKGIAGIGKTVLSQKFILDWSDDKTNQDIQLLFSLPFRELNLFRNQKVSLMALLYEFCPGLKESGIKDVTAYRVLFILDGLDECRFQLDFKDRCSDAAQSASVDVLLTSLIAGHLLPKANVWITTRPAAASLIPTEYINRVTEIRGFNNLQKEQYFHKKLEDEDLAKRVLANIRSARSLYIMCHVPLFCWISSIVLGKMCAKAGAGKMPKTLTQMYIHFLAHQTTQMFVKYSEEQQLDSEGNDMILALGKLAYQQLEKGNLIFYEDDLRECDIDVKEASVYSGVFTQVFREESFMQRKVFCFVHLSVQEFLAALYVHVVYKVHNLNLMKKTEKTSQTKLVSELHKAAVDRALQSDNGHLNLFLRFLLGLSLESNQGLLRDLKIQVEPSNDQSQEETIKYIKEKIQDESLPPVKCINLFHCLNELNDVSLVDDIQNCLDSDRDSVMDKCSSAANWAALVFVLLTSPERSEEIQLKKYSRTEEGLKRLLPAIKASTSAKLNDCNLTSNACQMLFSALSSASSQLCELDLTDNNIQDSGVEFLCSRLQSQQFRLKTLSLIRCGLTGKCCQSLASVLSFNSSQLRNLNLSHNDIEDSGVQLLCLGLGNKSCKLETLRLAFCSITQEGCVFLASAVKSNPSHLSELDLSNNHLGKSGEEMLSQALQEARCEFIKLGVKQNAEHWFKPGLRQYSRELTLDLNTTQKYLVVSEDKQTVSWSSKEQSYPDNPDRFDYWTIVLFQQGLTSRCYWEVEWTGQWAGIGVTYKSIGRKGPDNECVLGYNKLSWCVHCSDHGYRAYHDFESIVLPVPLARSRRVAVYLDWEGGVLSFYRVSSGGSLVHLHTFHAKFTEPLFPAFKVWGEGSSLRLCQVGKSNGE
ncbi:NACHT, LRR and PYD domains-containing protein 3-like isoform X2 [Acanthochromis polyacanthus]|uniref:NACHT, LRR and PYD domains-containing protein 3-like isoform X2 n=1 Tax=Acanthochromis polyacanthus TaxID=80966 RepID=UPI00223476A1|nr:NACHT, LRR and PYD domains-containing protein 3-like isoform X2 [Acanthochromis polyacanthus]